MAGIKDILNMDIDTFNKLDRRELSRVTSQLASAANKRLRRFEKAGVETPATSYVERSGGKFSVKGKDLNSLRAEFARVRGFLESRSGSLTGYTKIQKETAKTLESRGVNVTPDQIGTLMKTYEELKQVDPSISNKALKYRVLQEIAQMDEQMDTEEKILMMQERLDEIYEEQESLNADFLEGVSGYFRGV